MFFTQPKDGEVTLIVDIGSSSVGAALVSITKNVPPKVLFSTRLHVVLQHESERSQAVAKVVRTLELVMKMIAAEHFVVHKSHIFFSSPWYFSETSILKIDHDTPVIMTPQVIGKLIKEAEDKFVKESAANGEIVEHRIIRTRLNGYDTSEPYNKKVKNLEVTFFSSIVTKDILQSVRRTMEKSFHIRKNEISSFSLAAYKAVSSLESKERDFLVVDVRGDVTDVMLVTDGVLMKNLSFPLSRNALIRSLARGSGQSPTAALSLFKIAFQGNSDIKVRESVEKYAHVFKNKWLQEFTKTIDDISVGTVVPQRMFLLSDSDTEVFFEKMLSEIKNNDNIYLLKSLDMQSYLDVSSVQVDPFLALESIFVTMI